MIRPIKESLRYCILLIMLLATGALAVGVTINFLDGVVPDGRDRLILTAAIWTLTLGFMLIAGAFGLWTIHFATESESLRRISRLVDRLNDVRDAIFAADNQGNIIGMNAAAESLFGKVRGMTLPDVCPAISAKDWECFLHTQDIIEREYPLTRKDAPARTLRFRIQPPVAGISLLMVSDITSYAAAKTRQRRTATLQLAAHMAQGIANDFNDLLCGISGHVSLLLKPNATDLYLANSAAAIQQCADRGIRLARQLTELSQPNYSDTGSITLDTARHVTNGSDLLASNLEGAWTVEQKIDNTIPPVNTPPSQIEHIIHSLGLIIAETAHRRSGTLCITLRLPKESERIGNHSRIAGILEIARAGNDASTQSIESEAQNPETGVISSLVETLIVQAGGIFEAIPDGRRAHLFRLFLPEVDPESFSQSTDTADTLAIGLEAYTAGWQVLLCLDSIKHARTLSYLVEKNIKTTVASNEDAFLQALASEHGFDVIFLQPTLLGKHFDAFLPIIARICPDAAVVVLQEQATAATQNIITLNPASVPSQWIHAMVDARSRKNIPSARTDNDAESLT